MAELSNIGRVAVFGGSGFLGSEIVKRLTKAGIDTRVAVRHPDIAKLPQRSGKSGEISRIYADVRDETSVALAMKECGAVVNAVGLYVEADMESFEAVHELGALNVAHQCAVLGIKRLIHISGIGADMYSKSSYVRARGKGELFVRDAFPSATIFRPSVLFGPKDKFLNALARIMRLSPVFPLFGRGQTKLQPVYVGDIAEATLNALQDASSSGKTFELGGPHVYSYRAVVELVMSQTGRRRFLLPLPFRFWEFLAAVASILPSQPITHAQVVLMEHDNVVAASALSLQHLAVNPTALEDILPKYAF